MRRVEYLEDVGFLATNDGIWTFGPEGERYSGFVRPRHFSKSCADGISGYEAYYMHSRPVP